MTIQKISPDWLTDENIERLIQFKKTYLLQSNSESDLPNLSNLKNVIEKSYKSKPGYACYLIFDKEKIVARIHHFLKEENKLYIFIEHHKTAETPALKAILTEQMHRLKHQNPISVLDSSCLFIYDVIEASGFLKGNEVILSRLILSEVSPVILENWAGYLPEGFYGHFVESLNKQESEEIAQVMNFFLNDMERADRSIDFNVSAESIQAKNKGHIDRGSTQLHLLLRNPQHQLIGLSAVVYNAKTSSGGDQHMTGILPEYRKKGLAKFLKGTMYKYLLEQVPDLKFLQTGSFSANYKMLALNEKIGFQETERLQEWYYYSGKPNNIK